MMMRLPDPLLFVKGCAMWRLVLALGLVLSLSACGGDSDDNVTATPANPPSIAPSTPSEAASATTSSAPTTTAPAPAVQPTKAATQPSVSATETPSPAVVTADDVVAAFVAAGLEAEGARPMTRDDYGAAPFVGEGVRFLIPSLGEDMGGRIIVVPDAADRERLATYYRDLGKQSAMFFSHVFEVGDVVVQINGRLADDVAAQYEAALHAIGG